MSSIVLTLRIHEYDDNDDNDDNDDDDGDDDNDDGHVQMLSFGLSR